MFSSANDEFRLPDRWVPISAIEIFDTYNMNMEHEMVDWKEYIVMKRVYLYFSYLMQGLDY